MNASGAHADARGAAPRLSLWALASLPVALFVCMPFALTSLVLAIVGIMQIRRSEGRIRGTHFAVIALFVSGLAIIAQTAGLVWWNANIRAPMQAGPRDALVLGLSGNIEGFRAAFAEPGRATPREAEAFLAEVSARYGRLRGMEPDPFAAAPTDAPAPALPIVPYLLSFESGPVPSKAMFVTFGPARGLPNPVLRWAWIRIIDSERGDLIYPQAALSWVEAPATLAQPLNAQQPDAEPAP